MAKQIKLSDFNWKFVIQDKTAVEAGYVNDKTDSGGETNHGITKALAEQYTTALKTQFKWDGTMRNLSTDMAYYLYKTHFWDKMRLDDVLKRSAFLADRLFDFGINAGKAAPITRLQRILNVMNNSGTYYKDIKADGGMGDLTLGALDAYIAKRGKEGIDILIDQMFNMQGAYYVELAERREKDEKFVYGWSGRVRRERRRYEAIDLNGVSVE